jgi:hypothetical protein
VTKADSCLRMTRWVTNLNARPHYKTHCQHDTGPAKHTPHMAAEHTNKTSPLAATPPCKQYALDAKTIQDNHHSPTHPPARQQQLQAGCASTPAHTAALPAHMHCAAASPHTSVTHTVRCTGGTGTLCWTAAGHSGRMARPSTQHSQQVTTHAASCQRKQHRAAHSP